MTLSVEVDGLSGLEAARSGGYDLLLVDLNLPGMSGMEIVKRLRSDPTTSATPCIAVSANAMDSDISRARAAGFADCITKPLAVNHLIETVTSRRPRRAA